jgi:integral membrane sensor domain MASE1
MFWPPNVILLAALLVTPAQWWWPCGLTAFAAHLVVHAQLGGVPLVVMVVHFAGNMVRAVPAALALHRLSDPPWRVDTLRSMFAVIAVAGVAAPALASALVAHVYVLAGWVPSGTACCWSNSRGANPSHSCNHLWPGGSERL